MQRHRAVVAVRNVGLMVMGLLGLACTAPNPRSCADGSCGDPALPFCDVDGALGGTPDTCIAVACTPSEHAACRDDVDVRCNADGTNYDLVQCSLGCSDAVDGCVTCQTNAECTEAAPICDQDDHQCRGCTADAECESKVCDVDVGRCFAQSEVLYASATGPGTAPCTQLAPCSLPQAFMLALSNGLRSTVRLAPGRYVQELAIASGSVTLVGEVGVVLAGDANKSATVMIGRGGTLTMRDLDIDLSTKAFLCGGFGTSGPYLLGGDLTMTRVKVSSSPSRALYLYDCIATMRRVSFTVDQANIAMTSNAGTTVDADQLVITSTGASPARVHLYDRTRITNSVFSNAFLYLRGTGDQVNIAFNTFVVAQTAISFDYEGDYAIENNVIVSTSGNVAVNCSTCPNLNHNILYPTAVTAPGTTNLMVDPQLVDPLTRNYHLKPTSPAVNAAMPSAGLSTDHDHDGTPRPQGPALDIGAFELTP
ncbi:MAG: hypothetical protein JWP01_2749 [Myxococcales bacterium]|nr:hypothetical protein [Myxococcales bacterium]